MVTVARPFIILLISRSLLFFFFFFVLNKLSTFSSPHLFLFSQMHTNTSTQTNQQKDTLAQKKKKKKHRYTNAPTHKQIHMDKQQRDKLVLDRNDWCLIGTIGAHGSCLIGARRYGSCLIGA